MAACHACSHRERVSPFTKPISSTPLNREEHWQQTYHTPTEFPTRRLLHFANRPAFVIAAMRAGAVRLLHFVAIGTFCQGRLRKEVVSTPRAGTALGMSSLWIRHCNTPYVRLWSCARPTRQRSLFLKVRKFTSRNSLTHNPKTHTSCSGNAAFHSNPYCFLSQSCFSRARGASRGSLACVSQRHSS